ncbi:MAG: hypothetical protein IPH12_11510 [Saprospirales bacterium]|nr:hypothetical protein [Saprospirales bacterium]MBK8919950.1 hypothetical protein [Saprospirales bacterium]
MEFDVLRDLVQIITRNKVKQIEVLGNPGLEESRIDEFYDNIAKSRFQTDDDAARHFFGTDEKDPNYRKLRNRLIRQLINTSFFIDVNQPMFNERGKALYHCYRDYVAAYFLMTRDAHKASVYLLQQVLEQTIKFEFTELTADICRMLRSQYARTPGDPSNHDRYSPMHRLYEEKRYWEIKAFDYHENLIHYYISGRSTNEDIHEMASQYYSELLPKAIEIDTLQYYMFTYNVGVIKYLSVNNCSQTITICDQALHILQNRRITNRGALLSFAIQKLACLTQLRIFDDGDKTAQYCLDLAVEGEYNWFRVLETQFYYHMYTRQYNEALAVFEKVIQHPRYSVLSGSTRDMWTLHGGYLHLLAALGKLEPTEVAKVAGYYMPSTSRYSNDFEILDKEKEGMNIPLVLLPVLFSIARGNFEEEEYGRSVEALDKYRKRYLENDTNRRSAIFLKMILALSQKEFDGDRAKRKMQKEWQLLQQEPPQIAGQSFAVEIIPYEDIWQMLLEKQ